MKVYLTHHANALNAEHDPDCDLSKAGFVRLKGWECL